MGSKMYYSISLIVVAFSLLGMMTGPLTVQAKDSGSGSGSGSGDGGGGSSDGGGKSSDGGSNSGSDNNKGSSDNGNNNNEVIEIPTITITLQIPRRIKALPQTQIPDKDNDIDIPGKEEIQTILIILLVPIHPQRSW